MKKLKLNSYDGAHRGFYDWYKPVREAIQAALNRGATYEWTTDWYSSKHECGQCKITSEDGKLKIEVGVSDDMDTNGGSFIVIPFTNNLDTIASAISQAHDEAEQNRKANKEYVSFQILKRTTVYGMYMGGKPVGKPRRVKSWVETYLLPVGDFTEDGPGGDYYDRWGFQDEFDLPKDVKQELEKWAMQWPEHREKQFTYKNVTIKPYDE